MSDIERLMAGNPHYDAAIRAQTDQEAAMQSRLAQVWEIRTQNLIACSQKVYIRDSPDAIRERLGETPMGVEPPTPDQQVDRMVAALHKALSTHCYTKTYDDADSPGDVAEYGIDGLLDLREVARQVLDAIAEANGG